MTLILPIEPKDEAKLRVVAQGRGLTLDQLVQETIRKIVAEAPEIPRRKEETRSLRGLLAKYGPAPSADEIDENRRDMLANFPKPDL